MSQSERIFRMVDGKLTELSSRDPNKSYKYRGHPDNPKENVYVELTPAEEAQRQGDRAADAARQSRPRPPSVDELLQRIQTLEQALKQQGK